MVHILVELVPDLVALLIAVLPVLFSLIILLLVMILTKQRMGRSVANVAAQSADKTHAQARDPWIIIVIFIITSVVIITIITNVVIRQNTRKARDPLIFINIDIKMKIY